MKNHSVPIVLLLLISFIACKQPVKDEVVATTETVDSAEAPDYEAFDQKAGIIRSYIQAHSDEDLEKQKELLSDSLEYSPPYYNGNTWLGKADLLPILKKYHEDFENIKFTEGIVMTDTTAVGMWSGSVYPEDGASTAPDAIRVYGTWTAKHTASGKDVGVKWFALCWLNTDGKITRITEYFDVHGIEAQLKKK
jgi:hypothetical protein